MEYATPLHAGLSVVPKGTAFVGTLPDGSSKGLKWTSKYGFVGMNSYGLPVIIDGLNEKGLVAGGLLFPGYAGYEAFDAARADRTIAPVRSGQLAAFPVRHGGRGARRPRRRHGLPGAPPPPRV